MATEFEPLDEHCEGCSCRCVGKAFSYRVEEKRRLCDKCARHKDPCVLEIDAPMKWICNVHRTKLVELYCRPCQKGICRACLLTTHNGHQLEDIEVVMCQRKEVLTLQLVTIGQKEKELHNFDFQLSKCKIDVETHFKAVNNEVSRAADEVSWNVEKNRCDEAAKIHDRANEEIRKILEKRNAQLGQNNEDAEGKMKDIETNERTLTDKLTHLRTEIDDEMTKLKMEVKEADNYLKRAREKAMAVLTSNDKQLITNESINESVKKSLAVDLRCNTIDRIICCATNVKFIRQPVMHNVGQVVSGQCVWQLKVAIKCSQTISDLRLHAFINKNTIAFTNSSGSLHVTDVDSRETMRTIEGNGRAFISDCAPLDDTLVCGNVTSMCVSVYSKQGKHVRDIAISSDRTLRTVYTAVNKEGLILAARYYDTDISVMNLSNGQHRTVTLRDKVVYKGFHVTPSGLIVVQTGCAEFTVIDGSGVRNTIRFGKWKVASCGVDSDKDLLYVIYSTRPSNFKIAVVTLDGKIEKENIVEFSSSPRNIPVSGPILTSDHLVIYDGEKLLVYNKVPCIDPSWQHNNDRN